jgi:hypothetical protein
MGYWKKYLFAYGHLYPGECEAGKTSISRSLGVLAIDFHNNIDEAVSGRIVPGKPVPALLASSMPIALTRCLKTSPPRPAFPCW